MRPRNLAGKRCHPTSEFEHSTSLVDRFFIHKVVHYNHSYGSRQSGFWDPMLKLHYCLSSIVWLRTTWQFFSMVNQMFVQLDILNIEWQFQRSAHGKLGVSIIAHGAILNMQSRCVILTWYYQGQSIEEFEGWSTRSHLRDDLLNHSQ